MPNTTKNLTANAPGASTSTANARNSVAHPYKRLTKAQLVELLNGSITHPITPHDFYMCAAACLIPWCRKVIDGQYASICDLTTKLESLEKIYKQK